MTEAPLGDSIASTSRTRVKTQGRRRPAGSSVRCEHEPIRRERSEVANRAMVIASTEPVARVASRQWDRVRTPPAEGRQVPGTPVTLAPRDGRRVRPASRRVPWRAGAGKLNGVDSNSEVRRGRAAQTRIRNGGGQSCNVRLITEIFAPNGRKISALEHSEEIDCVARPPLDGEEHQIEDGHIPQTSQWVGGGQSLARPPRLALQS